MVIFKYIASITAAACLRYYFYILDNFIFNDIDNNFAYVENEGIIKAGFYLTVLGFGLGVATAGIGICIGSVGLVPLLIGLNRVLAGSGAPYSLYPVFLGAATLPFCLSFFHSFGYFKIIATDTTIKERSEWKKAMK